MVIGTLLGRIRLTAEEPWTCSSHSPMVGTARSVLARVVSFPFCKEILLKESSFLKVAS